MLALVVGVVALTRWRPGRTWSLLLVGLAALVVADVAYTLQSTDASLPGGDWIEPIYLLAAACIGAEAWQTRADTIQPMARFDGWRELMVPAFFATVMIGLFAIQYFSRASGLTAVLWAATMIAVIARLGLSVRENKRLLEQVRTDHLTGLGNQGRMQVDLAARCLHARAEPLTLLLLDLNGFKRYNDTFGHPAGRRDAEAPGRPAESCRRRRGLGLPDRRRRVRGADGGRGRAPRRGRQASGRSADRERPRLRSQRRLGHGDDPRGSRQARGRDAARRRAHVRAEGVAAPRPTTTRSRSRAARSRCA